MVICQVAGVKTSNRTYRRVLYAEGTSALPFSGVVVGVKARSRDRKCCSMVEGTSAFQLLHSP